MTHSEIFFASLAEQEIQGPKAVQEDHGENNFNVCLDQWTSKVPSFPIENGRVELDSEKALVAGLQQPQFLCEYFPGTFLELSGSRTTPDSS